MCGLAIAAGLGPACGQSIDQGQGDGGATVEVRFGADTRAVELDQLGTTTTEGNTGVPLSALIAAAFPQLDLDAVGADFAAEDGFRPASRAGCRPLIPVSGASLELGVLEPLSGSILWAPSLGFGGCMSVRGVVELLVVELGAPGVLVEVRADLASVPVDLRFQPTVEVAGAARVSLQGLVTASGVIEEPAGMVFDLEGADGFRPTLDRALAPLTWEQLGQGGLDPTSRDAAFDGAAGLPGTWGVRDVARVHVLSP